MLANRLRTLSKVKERERESEVSRPPTCFEIKGIYPLSPLPFNLPTHLHVPYLSNRDLMIHVLYILSTHFYNLYTMLHTYTCLCLPLHSLNNVSIIEQ